jgi:hypothetical protein
MLVERLIWCSLMVVTASMGLGLEGSETSLTSIVLGYRCHDQVEKIHAPSMTACMRVMVEDGDVQIRE